MELYDKFFEQKRNIYWKAFNVGGGINYSLSLLEFIEILKEQGLEISYTFGDWRPGDQKVFVSDNTKVIKELGWEPKTTPVQGIKTIVSWVKQNKDLLKSYISD